VVVTAWGFWWWVYTHYKKRSKN